MSFILDALKKSETERQRQDTPGIASIPQGGQRKSASKWVWLIVALLTVNLAVVSGLILNPGTEPQPVVAETPAAVVSNEPETSSFSDMVSEAKRKQPRAVATEPEPIVSAAPPEATTPAVINAPPQTVSEGLATFNELRAQGMLQLPDMHLDIHVYSGQPAERFVFVNMSKYREQSTLAEGPQVREITPDGVVLDYRGTAFLLPRE